MDSTTSLLFAGASTTARQNERQLFRTRAIHKGESHSRGNAEPALPMIMEPAFMRDVASVPHSRNPGDVNEVHSEVAMRVARSMTRRIPTAFRSFFPRAALGSESNGFRAVAVAFQLFAQMRECCIGLRLLLGRAFSPAQLRSSRAAILVMLVLRRSSLVQY
jgi:hypothetical protein